MKRNAAQKDDEAKKAKQNEEVLLSVYIKIKTLII